MINCVIFSFNRAMQLRLLLESISKNAAGVFHINILYKSSNDEFKSGYEKLKSENILHNIKWIEEKNFRDQTLELLNPNKEHYGYTCFFTDDDIIFNLIDEETIVNTIENDSEIFTFSLRLGENVIKCYTMACDNILGDHEVNENIIKWDWTKRYFDFGYPLSVDGHVFRTKDIFKLAKSINFFNPNTFEGGLQIFDDFPKCKMSSYKHSVLVNSPSNIVNETHPNRKGEQHGITAEEFNKKYLEGEVIDFDSISFEGIVGCHQELLLPLKKISTCPSRERKGSSSVALAMWPLPVACMEYSIRMKIFYAINDVIYISISLVTTSSGGSFFPNFSLMSKFAGS